MALGNKTIDDLLNPIVKQLGHAGIAEAVALPEWEFKARRVTDGLSHGQLVDLFASEAEKVRVQVRRTTSDGLAGCIAQIVGQGVPGEGGPASVVCADDERFAYVKLPDVLRDQQLVSDVMVWDPSRGRENVDAALAATYGITYAAGGIAETATVVQPTSPKCGRAVSLLPLVHIAVVNATAIVPTMGEVMDELGDSNMPSQVCFISGPSATADIELVRVEGVHGPMYVHYVIVE